MPEVSNSSTGSGSHAPGASSKCAHPTGALASRIGRLGKQVAGCCSKPIRDTVSWVFGRDRAVDDKQRQSELISIITLFIFVVGQAVSPVITEHRKDVRLDFLLVYAVIGIATSVVLICIVRVSKTTKQGSEMYRYDRGTKIVAQVTLGCCLVLVPSALVLGWFNLLPGQKAAPIRLYNIEAREELADTGFPGLVLYAQFGQDQFPNGVPERFDLLVDLDESVQKDWELNVARVFVETEAGELVEASERFAEARPDRKPVEVGLAGLREEQAYIVAMQLIPRSTQAIQEFDEFHRMREGDTKTAKRQELIDKYSRLAQDTRKALFEKGSLTLKRRL